MKNHVYRIKLNDDSHKIALSYPDDTPIETVKALLREIIISYYSQYDIGELHRYSKDLMYASTGTNSIILIYKSDELEGIYFLSWCFYRWKGEG